jgi:heterodisulfide reductase subunit A
LSIRIGVFICHCGNNIAGVIDVSGIAEYASTLPHVAHVETNLYTCSEEGIAGIKKNIKEHALDRIVVAACTPRTHEHLFKQACEQAGINRHLFEFVNIREHCSWIHQSEPDRATNKARELIRMGVSKVAHLMPQTDIETPVHPSALVIGAGVSGMSAALNMANQGIDVHLIEREKKMGGLIGHVDSLYPSGEVSSKLLRRLASSLKQNKSIHIHLGSEARSVEGSIGDFKVTIGPASGSSKQREFTFGTIVVATGASELKPNGMFGYGKMKNVLTELELEDLLKNKGKKNGADPAKPRNFVFINCVGARNDKREYCSRFCCMTSMKNALRLKSMNPDNSVTILERDVMACGITGEEYYRAAKKAGIKFMRYGTAAPPKVIGKKKPETVRLRSPVAGGVVEIPADMVVLTTPLVPQPDSKDVARMLRIPLGGDGFFLEAHVKLRPVEFSNDGIYVCGSARFPVNVRDAMSQGYAAAAKAVTPIRQGKVIVEPITAYCIHAECTGCGNCEAVCPYDAIALQPDQTGKTVACVTEVKCKGCGCCVAACPAGVMQQRNWGDLHIHAPLNAIEESSTSAEPKILVFECNWCSYAGADLAGVSRFQIPHNLRVIRVMCSSRVKPEFIVKALANGIDGVMVLGCHPGECHYADGNLYTRRRAVVLKQLLTMAGIDPRRFKLDWVSASEGKRYAELVTQFTEELRTVGRKWKVENGK